MSFDPGRERMWEKIIREIPSAGIYYDSRDKRDPNFDTAKHFEEIWQTMKKDEQKLDVDNMYFCAIVAMAFESYSDDFNEEYNKIAGQYVRNEISKETFLEELSYLKMAIKLTEE